MYEVRFHPSAALELETLDARMRRRVARAVDRLAQEPRGGAVKLRGAADLWRLRVGDYRVVYQIRDAILVVLVIGCAIAARPTGEPSIER
jgi:mRNA interferase RelE/StbE